MGDGLERRPGGRAGDTTCSDHVFPGLRRPRGRGLGTAAGARTGISLCTRGAQTGTFLPASLSLPPGPSCAGRCGGDLEAWSPPALGLGSGPLGWRSRDPPTTGCSWLKVCCGELRVSGRAHPGLCLRWSVHPHFHPVLGDLRPWSPAAGVGLWAWGLESPRGGGWSRELLCALHSPRPMPSAVSLVTFLFQSPLSPFSLPGRNFTPLSAGKGPRAHSLHLRMVTQNDFRD